MVNTDTPCQQLSHSGNLWELLIGTFHQLEVCERRANSPFNRFKALSQTMCTSLFSLASHKSIFCKLLAYSSHRFLLNTKLTTGSNFDFLRWLMRCVQVF